MLFVPVNITLGKANAYLPKCPFCAVHRFACKCVFIHVSVQVGAESAEGEGEEEGEEY